METALVLLPTGREAGSAWDRTAFVSALTGRDELAIAGDIRGTPPERARKLLARCAHQVCGLSDGHPEAIGGLTVGDRDALLLHVRHATLGDRLSAVVTCPRAQCGEALDIDLTVGELLTAAVPDARAWHDIEVEDGGASWQVRFRLPTAADMEKAAGYAGEIEAALSMVLSLCVAQAVRSDGVSIRDLDAWPPALVDAISEAMRARDAQAEVRIAMECPACNQPFDSVLDIADYVTRELASRAGSVFREVHTLALRYHWAEREILDLPVQRRRLYLQLLAETEDEEELS